MPHNPYARLERFDANAPEHSHRVGLDPKMRWRLVHQQLRATTDAPVLDVLDGFQDGWDLIQVLNYLADSWRCIGGNGVSVALLERIP